MNETHEHGGKRRNQPDIPDQHQIPDHFPANRIVHDLLRFRRGETASGYSGTGLKTRRFLRQSRVFQNNGGNSGNEKQSIYD